MGGFSPKFILFFIIIANMSRRLLFIGRGTFLNTNSIVHLIRWAPTQTVKAHYEIHTVLSNQAKKKVTADEAPPTFKVFEDDPGYQIVTDFIKEESPGGNPPLAPPLR